MKLSDPQFHDDEAGRAFLEALRWPEGPICGHCGVMESAMPAKGGRPGRYRCNACRKDFTVTTGTVMESSHIGLSKWLWTFYSMAASKKGISAHQVHRTLGITYKSAWFLCHRVREAMDGGGGLVGPLGGEGKIVEADETYLGRSNSGEPTKPKGGMRPHKDRRPKRAIVSLVERGGSVRSFHVATADKATVAQIVIENVDPASRLHTDESRLYTGAEDMFASHETVKHSAGEYARGDVNTNSVEGYFSVFKRGMRGTYQHCAEKHLHRYLAEFDFRHNSRTALGVNDSQRAVQIIKGAEGKRLTYRRTREQRAPGA